jgi:hypothetical protein
LSSVVLFVFEGERREQQIFQSVEKCFPNSESNIRLISVYGTCIYNLYKDALGDGDAGIDFVELIRERSVQNAAALEEYSRSDVAEIYLIFDYDGHDQQACDNKISEMLDFFREETENGFMFLSYPMSEAFFHYVDDDQFKSLTSRISEGAGYKGKVDKEQGPQLRGKDQIEWEHMKPIIRANCKKANLLVNGAFDFPTELLSSQDVFNEQLRQYIPDGELFVLSGFPLFFMHYIGAQKFRWNFS